MSKKSRTSKASPETGTVQTHAFQAETRQVLHLMIHSLYSNKEIFLRELVSNASDALDRLRFASVQDKDLQKAHGELQIQLETDPKAQTLTIRDNGIGMSFDEVMENIGTIARSGTKKFLEALGEAEKSDSQLIGQFGVGFYSAFIVADSVTLLTRKAGAGADEGVRWHSDGGGEFTIEPTELENPGTTVVLHLKDAEKEFLQNWTIRSLVGRYSDHVAFPIRLKETEKAKSSGEDSDGPAEEAIKWVQINKATALWARPKNEISDEEYQVFYKHLAHDADDAMCWAHNKVEGTQNYTTLMYLPRNAPMDMMLQRDERQGLKLYVNRVFIMDAAQSLLPQYLRFMRGVVDSQDLPLNVSRELLQENELLTKIRAAVTRRSLDMLDRLAKDQPEDFAKFWKQFGAVIKEGVVEDMANRDRILKLLRLASTHDETPGALTDLPAYIERMKPGQDAIYYITAEHEKAARNSPHLELFRRKDIEVLLLSERVDEWMMAYLHEFEGKPFKSVAKGSIDLSGIEGESEAEQDSAGGLGEDMLKRIADALGDQVSAVQSSKRLTDSASCLVLDEQEMALHLQQMLRQAGQEVPESRPVLELNPKHHLVNQLVEELDDDRFASLAQLLFEQALLSEGGMLPDPAGFVRRINAMLSEQAQYQVA
jgi:molecular chaperone HtpG